MDPASIATLASSLATGASIAHAGLKVAHHLGTKYIPMAKNFANHVFSRKSRQSAKEYLNSLKTKEGLQKAVTKDLPSAVKSASKFVASGKLLKGAKEVATDVGSAVSAVEGLTGKGKVTRAITKATEQGVQGVQSVADLHNQFVSDFAKHNNRRALGMS